VVTPTYLPRSWWADDDWPRGGAQLVDDDLDKLGNVCHYPGRASAFGIMTLSNLRSNLRGWYNFHVNTRGWSDIGYQMCMSMTTEGPVVVDLRGIGRVPAAHASASNPRANWHGGATLWTIGNTETIHPDLIEAYRHFRTQVWLKRWPVATGVTHHRRVPGAQTSCAGDNMDKLVLSGTLRQPPIGDPGDDEMSVADARQGMMEILREAYEASTLPDEQRTATGRAARKYIRTILLGTDNHVQNAVLNTDGIVKAPPSAATAAENPFWSLASHTTSTTEAARYTIPRRLDQLEAKVDAALALVAGVGFDEVLQRIDQVATTATLERAALVDRLDLVDDVVVAAVREELRDISGVDEDEIAARVLTRFGALFPNEPIS
jgi:hypothetical protein